MDVVAGHWGVGTAVDEVVGTAEGPPPWVSPQDKWRRLPVWTRPLDCGVASAVDVVARRWGGVAAVNKVMGTGEGALPWTSCGTRERGRHRG